ERPDSSRRPRPGLRDARLQRPRPDRGRPARGGERMKRPGPLTDAHVWKVMGNRPHSEADRLATEEPMEIRIESGARGDPETTSLSVTMRTPGNDFELAAGFLFSEGIVARPRDIVRIEYCTDSGAPHAYNVVTLLLRPPPH